MKRNPHSASYSPAHGGLIRLQVRVADLITWLGPAWAALCGVVASGGFHWREGGFLRLALLILLVDGGWGTLWAALGSTDWAKPLRRWRNWRFGDRAAVPPYTLPGAPGDRLSRWLGQLRAWWRDILWPTCGPAVSAAAIALPVTGILGALLGPKLLLLSLAALATMQLGLAWRGFDAAIAVAFPWLAGHVAFGALTPGSAGLALLLTLAWGAAWYAEGPRGRALGVGGQLLAAALLVALRRPLAAGVLTLLLVPQLALLPWLPDRHTSWYSRHTRPWLMAAMLIAAWAV